MPESTKNEWNAAEFYGENSQSAASFVIGTTPIHTDLRGPVEVVLSKILHERLGGYGFLGTVHTARGDRALTSEEYTELLRIQESIEDERTETARE